MGNVVQIVDGQVLTQTQSFVYDALDRLTGASAQAGGPWAAYSGSYEYDRVGNLRLKAEGGITHTMQYSNTAHVHAVSAVDGAAQSYDANGNMTERVIDGVTYTQGWDQENRLVWVSTGGVTTTFTYDANGALVKKEDPLVGTTYYVGPHYEVLAPAVILPPAPTDLEACHASGSPPNVCNDLTWTGSLDVTYNIYRNSTSPVPIDAGHLVTSGITETNYTDCGNVNNRYYAVTAVNENGESDPSNEDRASEPCGSALALTLPVLNATALTETGGDPVVTKYYFHGGKRVAMDRDGVVQWLVGDHLGTTSLVLNADGTVHSEARHYPYGEERWSSGTLPTDYRFTGQRSDSGLRLIHMGARFYDSALGRWISADTLVPDPGSPQSLNRYSYVRNSPLGYVDPTGHARYGGDDYDPADEPLPPRPEELPDFSDEQWAAMEYWAEYFGLPVEFLAAVIAAEIVWETDWYDAPIDFGVQHIARFGMLADGGYPFKWCDDFLERSQSGLPIVGLSFGLGKGQVHADTAIEAEAHFGEGFPLRPSSASMRHLMLIDDETNTMYVAATLRMYADQRPGSLDVTGEMSVGQMGAVFANYHEDVATAFESAAAYRRGNSPLSTGMYWFHQLVPFVSHYRRIVSE